MSAINSVGVRSKLFTRVFARLDSDEPEELLEVLCDEIETVFTRLQYQIDAIKRGAEQ